MHAAAAVGILFFVGACSHIPTNKEVFAKCLLVTSPAYDQLGECIDDGITAAYEARERRRAAALIIGASLQGAGQGLQSARPRSNYTPNNNGCTSDYDCRFGNVCVKPPYKYRGTCAVPVDDFGNRTNPLPRTDSYKPGARKGQCSWDTDCPIGFSCTKASGQIYGHCMK